MENIKLYAFSTGALNVKKKIFAPGKDGEELIKAPVQAFLIKHPEGNVLVDTGYGIEVSLNPDGCWGEATAKSFRPSMNSSEEILYQLKELGITNRDINYILLTHLHMDHCGNLKHFPYANMFVQDKEFAMAQHPKCEFYGYYRRDWDYPFLYTRLKGSRDLFNDGTIIMEPMPGHTDGMQVIVINLPKSGTIVIASDAAAMEENLNRGVVPRNIRNKEEYLESIAKLQKMKKDGALIICGHDPNQWKKIKKAPKYYE